MIVRAKAARDTAASPEPPLVERLLQGDEAALRESYLAHRPALLRFARRLIGDAAAAHDLVHEVFVRLPRAIRRLRPGASLEGFLIAVAVNHARHHVRAAARRRRAQLRLAQEPRRAPDRAPDQELERRRLALALSSALDRLPIDQRVAFVLCAVEERTSAEAAALAGTNESTMRARLFHARRKLREHLAGYHDGGDS
ncbi:MAG TPA: RNA polymerase sigma factor [Polyangia bacterium]|nr:RNA polymerase sigma factor [Polyangia bacterium]